MRFLMVVLSLAAMTATAETEIHRCPLDDGTFSFQQSPCADDSNEVSEQDQQEEAPAAEDDALDFVNPFDEPASPAPEPALPKPVSQDREECEKMTRDAIDAIDLEMRDAAYTKEQGREYLEELLELTRQLRACKQL